MKKWSYFCSLAICLALFFSCKKDEGPSNTELLTDHCWILSTSVVDPALNGITDLYTVLKPCEKDNTICFSTGGTVTTDEGALKCTPTDPQVQNGTWKLENDEKIFKFILSNGVVINADLLELSKDIIKIGINMDLAGKKYYATQTYKPK